MGTGWSLPPTIVLGPGTIVRVPKKKEVPRGNFTYSSITFLYLNGTDNQTGYDNPYVWFLMNTSIPTGGTFFLLNTEMTIISKDQSYFLISEEPEQLTQRLLQAVSSYERNDEYGVFNAAYTWNAFFDPSTGYIIGYTYTEHDSDGDGNGFAYTDSPLVNSTSYHLSDATVSGTVGGDPGFGPYLVYIAVVVLVLVVLGIIVYALSGRPEKPFRNTHPDMGRRTNNGQVRSPASI